MCVGYPFFRLKMPKLQSFRLFVNERLTAAAVEIFGAVEKTIIDYHEENERLRRLLQITPEMRMSLIDSQQFSVMRSRSTVENQHCEQELSPSSEQEDPEISWIKKEQEEFKTGQTDEPLQGIFGTENSIFTPPSVKREYDQEEPVWFLTLPQTQSVENSEGDCRQVDLKPFDTVTLLKGLDVPCDPDNQYNVSGHSPALNSDPVGLDSSPPLDPSPMPHNTHCCPDSGKEFALNTDPQKHVDHVKGLYECNLCKKHYNSNRTLKAHVQSCHTETSYTCPLCGKTIKRKIYLSRHMRIHTGGKPFNCGECGKSFNQSQTLSKHKLTHTGEKPFRCGECGKSFSQRQNLSMHKMTHTVEKPFSCSYCKKIFYQKGDLSNHILMHIGEKPFSCAECGKSFRTNSQLTRHNLTHTGEKPFICGDCGKRFSLKQNLSMHNMTHTGEKPFSCGECGKGFSQKWSLIYHIQTHKQVK